MPTKILFYTSNFRALCTTHLGYLHELAQHFEVILASEPIDNHTKTILLDKSLFPGLIDIIEVDQYRAKEPLLKKNKRLSLLSKELIDKFLPQIVIASSDNDSIFELYLLRRAKINSIHRITINATINPGERSEVAKWYNLTRVNTVPKVFPKCLRSAFASLKGYIGHVLVYWLLPLLNWESPFWGSASYICLRGHSGIRDSEFHIVLSRREQGIHLRSGVPKNKITIIHHPLTRQSRLAFERLHLSRPFNFKQPIALVLNPAESYGFTQNLDLIETNKYLKARYDAVECLVNQLAGWTILLKPHPSTSSISVLRNLYHDLLEKVIILDFNEPVEPYIMRSNLVVDLPRAASTSMLFARLWSDTIHLLALDFHREFMGDCHKYISGIQYLESVSELNSCLRQIRNGPVQNTKMPASEEQPDFPNLSAFIHAKGFA